MSNLFEALAAAGFGDDLVPIAPPDGALSSKSKKLKPCSVGKVPCKLLDDGWCGFYEWEKHIANPPDFVEWGAWEGVGVGVICRSVLGLDVDVMDKAIAEEIKKIARAVLGKAPCRIGREPKFLLAYRLADGEGPIKKSVASIGKHKIELLGADQQFVVAGIHKDTRKPYRWEGGDLVSTGFDGLVEITIAQLEKFLDRVEQYCDLAGLPFSRQPITKMGAAPSPLAPRDAGPGCVLTDEEIANLVAYLKVTAAAEEGNGGDKRTLDVANGCMDRGADQDLAFELMLEHYNPRCVPEWDARELRVKVDNACKSREEPIGSKRRLLTLPQHTFTTTKARPTIQIQGGFLPANVDAAEAALAQGGASVYQRGEMIVAPTRVVVPASDERSTVAVRLKQLTAPAIVEEMTKAAQFQRFDKRSDEWRSIDCPPNVAATYLARAEWKLPVLVGVVTAPTLRSDGSILDVPGYDAATGFLYDPGSVKFDPIPAQPSRDEALSALATIKHLISTVPFTTLAARSVALAAILTGVARSSVPTAPWFGFSAPVAGSGKTMVCDIVSEIAHGDAAPIVAQGRTEEETEKRLGAMLIEGANLINLDNCTLPLSGDLMCQMTTEKNLKVRVLGQSRTVLAPVIATLLATGNNLTVAGDMTRRVLLAEIDPGVERPELRTFNFDPIALIRADRPKYVAAVLTILRAFWVAGRPSSGIVALASFAEWSRTIRDALVWLGESDPVTTTADTRESDPERTQLAALLHNWAGVIGDRRVTVKQAIDSATVSSATSDSAARMMGLREALAGIAESRSGHQALDAKRLGMYLSRVQGRIVDGRSIERAGILDGAQMWRLSGSVAATA